MFGKPFEGNKKEFLGRIGVMIETPGFYPNLTATENLEILADLRGYIKRDAIKESLGKVGLPYKDKKLFSEFSLGMKQRLGIAAAIIHDPEVLILDEPVNGLDPIGVMETRNFIRELSQNYGKTILLSSHILSEIELLADRIGIIDKGILLEESPFEELKKEVCIIFCCPQIRLKQLSICWKKNFISEIIGLWGMAVFKFLTQRYRQRKSSSFLQNRIFM